MPPEVEQDRFQKLRWNTLGFRELRHRHRSTLRILSEHQKGLEAVLGLTSEHPRSSLTDRDGVARRPDAETAGGAEPIQ